jgi:hypothetical protein
VSPHILQVESSDQGCFTGTKLQIVIVKFAFYLGSFLRWGKPAVLFLLRVSNVLKKKVLWAREYSRFYFACN